FFRLLEKRQQHIVNVFHRLENERRLMHAFKGMRALVVVPQAELSTAYARQLSAALSHCQFKHQLVLPVEQGSTLTLALGRHVLHDREQTVSLFCPGVTI